MLENVIKKLFPIRDEEDRPCTFPTFASQVFFNDGSVLEGKQFGGGAATVDPLDKFEIGVIYHFAIEVNPPEKYGGEWEKINGRILIGTGTPEANSDGTSPGSYNYGLNIKGGEAEHTLTSGEMPEHRHGQKLFVDSQASANIPAGTCYIAEDAYVYASNLVANRNEGIFGNTYTSGNSKAHNNMPPHLAVNMWQRIR